MPEAPRIHWFSPLRPARTDIAHYTGRVLPALAARASVTLWTDQPHWSFSLERHAAVRRFDPHHFPWEALHAADAVFYNIGNDARFHRSIGIVSRRFPGFSILHDVLLHDSVSFDCQEHHDRDGYLQIMQAHYGARGRRDGELFWKGVLSRAQLSHAYSCAPFFLASSLGAIVHSRTAESALAEEVDVPVIRLPLPYPARRRAPRPTHESAPPWKLVVFGYLGVNRCLEQILTAVALINGQIEDRRFHLHIYGAIEDGAGLAAAIGRLQMDGQVTIHGFVPEPELDAALASAHLGLNLRYPTKGEASGSQLRIWSHGLPSLVTRVGWYAELPHGTVSYVRPNFLVEDVCAHLRAYAARPDGYLESGIRGYAYFVERHSPANYAAKIVDLARQAGEYRQRWNALRIGRRAMDGLDGWFPVQRLGEYVGHVADVVSGMS
jgi:glycosyltransferase involved in cell wall biosynthesis